jgi:hypothetical protein
MAAVGVKTLSKADGAQLRLIDDAAGVEVICS